MSDVVLFFGFECLLMGIFTGICFGDAGPCFRAEANISVVLRLAKG
jgi:hypothetical protein